VVKQKGGHRRRPPSAAFKNYADAAGKADTEAIAKLFGSLPAWFPESKRLQITQDLATLGGAGLTVDMAADLVKQQRAGQPLVIPGTAKELGDINFIRSVYDLANIQWALELPEKRAISELAGSRAAQDYQRTKAQMSALPGARLRARLLRKPKITSTGYEAAKKGSRSRKELASRLGVSLQAVRDFEKNKKK
jgi:hypothetical protein